METERIGLLLPEVYRRAAAPGSPLTSLLEVMSQLHAPVEQVVATFPSVLDPWRTPDRFVPFLARWVGLDGWLDEVQEISTGHGRLRVLVAEASEIARLRGTAGGLRLALTLALGVEDVSVTDEVVGSDGALLPFHVRVTVPADAADHLDLVRRIVAEEKAAHAVVEVVVAGGGVPAEDPVAGEPAPPSEGSLGPPAEGVPPEPQPEPEPAPVPEPAPEPAPAPAPPPPPPPPRRSVLPHGHTTSPDTPTPAGSGEPPPSFPPEHPTRRPDPGEGEEA